MRKDHNHRGFTLIELMVTMAIVALLVAIAAPRYFKTVDRARENSLKQSLQVMRDAIDQFAADQGRYPKHLQEMVSAHYLRQIPEDPLTGRRDSWVLLAPPGQQRMPGGVYDVRSGMAGKASDGRLYADW